MIIAADIVTDPDGTVWFGWIDDSMRPVNDATPPRPHWVRLSNETEAPDE